MAVFEIGQIWINDRAPDQPGKIVAIEDNVLTVLDLNRNTLHRVTKEVVLTYCTLSPSYAAAKEFDEDLEKLLNDT